MLLLDEPFAALDATLRTAVRRDVTRILAETGATAVIVTHDQDEALSMADHVAVLVDGRLVDHADPRAVYEGQVGLATAPAIGEVSLLDGIAEHGTARSALGPTAISPRHLVGPVRLAVRAEQVDVLERSAVDGIEAEVVGYEFFGHDALVRCALLTSDVVITARVAGSRRFAMEEPVRLRVLGDVRASMA